MIQTLGELFVRSVTAPREVAAMLIGRELPGSIQQAVFGLVVVLNSMMLVLQDMTGRGGLSTFGLELSPFAIAGFVAATLLTSILAFTWGGRLVGGQGSYLDMSILILWLQGWRLVVQVVLFLALPLGGAIVGLAGLVASGVALYMLVTFVMVGHRMDSLPRAIFVIVFALILLGFTASGLLQFAGLVPQGGSQSV